jgi:RimJ/RimL family protein N-acetyltransferase
MELHLTADPEELATRAGRLLSERVELNVLATVLLTARTGAPGPAPPLFAYGVEEDGETVSFVALRIPPWPMLAGGDVAAADPHCLIERWLERDPELDALSGQPHVIAPLGRAWVERTGGVSRVRMRGALHVLTEVCDPDRPASGELREAGKDDRALLIAWEDAFVAEADAGVAGQAERTVDRRLVAGLQQLWVDGGKPVSTLVLNHMVAGTVRVGVVYTPPEHRGRGYASSAVAAASRLALARGAERCMLFTDLANPTSNRIYAAVGYRRVGDWEDRVLERASTI